MCAVAQNYRYALSHGRVQCTVELSVTQCENVKGVRTHESLIHGSTMMMHNMITLKAFRHASVFSILFYDDATQYKNARNVLDTYIR